MWIVERTHLNGVNYSVSILSTAMTMYFTFTITNRLQSLLIRRVLVAVGGTVPVVLGIVMQRSGGMSRSYPTISLCQFPRGGWARRAVSLKVDRQVTKLDAAASHDLCCLCLGQAVANSLFCK